MKTKNASSRQYSTKLAQLCPGFVLMSEPLGIYSREKTFAASELRVARGMRDDMQRAGIRCKFVSYDGYGFVMREAKGFVGCTNATKRSEYLASTNLVNAVTMRRR